MTNFQKKVLKLVSNIPRGKVSTYQFLAKKLGNKKLARAVGNALNKNQKLITIPCHRVVKSNGLVGGYKLGTARKIKLLDSEGIIIKKEKIVCLAECFYKF
ncbi:MAG: MGMT family protein [Patescibacteria group bacterium]|nr:MGMT family protein [Patescibacteria group bacterium]